MKEYLIIKCDELGDQFECDADRTPLCITTNYSKYGLGYEVWEKQTDNSFKRIKDYDEAKEQGFALYSWGAADDPAEDTPTLIDKKIGWERDSISKAFVKKLKQEVGFQETVNDIFNDIQCCGSHGEDLDDKWVVFGEYRDGYFSCGY